jgi:hypothetical protein
MPITSTSSSSARFLVVDLDQAVEVQPAGLSVELRQAPVVEDASYQQHRVGPVHRRLVELVGIDDEVLAQDRQVAGVAGGAQVLERPAEVALVGEHRERRRAAALVGAHLGRDGSRGGDIPGAGRAALELGDQREPGPHQGLVERAVLAARGQAGFEVRLRRLAAALLHPFSRHRDQLLDHCHLRIKA